MARRDRWGLKDLRRIPCRTALCIMCLPAWPIVSPLSEAMSVGYTGAPPAFCRRPILPCRFELPPAMLRRLVFAIGLLLVPPASSLADVPTLIRSSCVDCHDAET